MFSLLSGLWQYIFSKPKIHVLIVGLDHAGKTTLLERIKALYHLPSIPLEKIPPTIGMNLAKIVYRGHVVIIWDLGGQIKMRNIWEKYYEDAHAILFVVDSADLGRLEEAKLAYEAICDHDSNTNTPIFIVANKQDLGGALLPADLAMNFYAIQDAADRARVFPVSAVTGEGLDAALTAIIEEAKRTATRGSHR
eukprot:gene8889-9808_t